MRDDMVFWERICWVIGTRKRDGLQKKFNVNGKGNTLHSSSIAALQNIIYGAQFNYLDSIKNHKIGLKMGREAIQLRYVG
jgi:hypothetical protein